MSCSNIIKNGNGHLKCKNGGYCPFQYWCSQSMSYKSTATSSKCNQYKEAENSEQLNKK